MPLGTYSDLQGEVASWLRRSDLSAEIPTFITLAEAQMSRRLRVRPMGARLAVTWSTEYSNLPSDFVAERALKIVFIGADFDLSYVTPEQMDTATRAPTYGQPRFYSIYGGQLRLFPIPDQAYTGEITYLQAIPALSDTNPSNWLLAAHPDAYLYGALAQSAPYLKADERLSTWSGLFLGVLADIEASDRTGHAAKLRSETSLLRARRGGAFDYRNGGLA